MDSPHNHPTDIWEAILGHIDCGSDYKAVCLVDRLRHTIARKIHPTADTKFANQLTTLVVMVDRGEFLPKGFATGIDFLAHINMCGIIGNPNISTEFIDNHIETCNNWVRLGNNPNITITWLEKLAKVKGDGIWSLCSHCPCITMDYVLAHPNILWGWIQLTMNAGITMTDIATHPELPWIIPYTSHNPNFTQEFAVNNLDDFIHHPEALSQHPCVTIDIIRAYPDFPWYWDGLAINPSITDEIIKANPDLPWSQAVTSLKPRLTIDYIRDNPHADWRWGTLTTRFSLEEIMANSDLPWDMNFIRANSHLTWEFIDSHPDGILNIPWEYARLGDVRGLTWKRIIELDRAGVAWNWFYICANRFGRP